MAVESTPNVIRDMSPSGKEGKLLRAATLSSCLSHQFLAVVHYFVQLSKMCKHDANQIKLYFFKIIVGFEIKLMKIFIH